MKVITRTVWIVSVVSLLTDTASEMLYPVLPAYLKSIGFSVVLIGLLEGLAEAAAGLSKGYFGKLSDHTGKRMPFVQLGYALSALSKPMIVLFAAPAWVFFTRTLDRLGKGVRSGARDAVLAAEATPATKATIFGFHRSMDTLGAVAGPALALWYLASHPQQYKYLFYLAILPGLGAVACTLLLKDKPTPPKPATDTVPFFAFLGYWRSSPIAYRQLVAGLLAFAVINSSDVFLLLQAREVGLTDTAVIGAYIFYNLVYALAAYPMGMLADRLGMKRVLLAGLCFFAATYIAVAHAQVAWHVYAAFFLYGLYAAATEGISKAWISTIVGKGQTATALGTFAAFQSVGTLLASILAGLLWHYFGSAATLMATGIVALCVLAYLLSIPYQRPPVA